MGLANEIFCRESNSRCQIGADRCIDVFTVALSVVRTPGYGCSHRMFSRWRRQEVPNAHEVVGRRHEHGEPVDLRGPAPLNWPHRAEGLPPTEHFLDPLAQSLADRVAPMARRAAVDRTGFLLSDVRRYSKLAQLLQEGPRIVVLVATQGPAPAPHDLQRGRPLRGARGWRGLRSDHQPVAVLDHEMPQVTQLCFLPLGLLV